VFELDAIAYPGNSGSPVWHPTPATARLLNSVYVKGAKETAALGAERPQLCHSAKVSTPLLEQPLFGKK